ncbi:MAG: hypothetical protein IJX92_05290 [Clostridia bacterium]|nr:hypothetical protein [Clostridia bacterium]
MEKFKEIFAAVKKKCADGFSKVKAFLKKMWKEISALFEIIAILIKKAASAVKKFFIKVKKEIKALFEIIGMGLSFIGRKISALCSIISRLCKRACDFILPLYHKYKEYILPALIILTGALYILASLIIFFGGGEKPYSRESVGAQLIWLSVPSAITVIATVVTGIKSLLEERREAMVKLDTTERAYRLVKRLTLGASFSEEAKEKFEYERKIRRDIILISLGATAVVSLISAILILNPNKYTIENLNGDIVSSVFIALPAVVVGFGSAIFAKQVCLASLSRETAVIKEEMKTMGERPKAEPKPHFTETAYYRVITVAVRASVTALALVFIVLGIMNGGMADVINKAVKICTECIGLG